MKLEKNLLIKKKTMKKNKGYIVLEIGFEYNDEYYHTGNYGAMYEAPKKV